MKEVYTDAWLQTESSDRTSSENSILGNPLAHYASIEIRAFDIDDIFY